MPCAGGAQTDAQELEVLPNEASMPESSGFFFKTNVKPGTATGNCARIQWFLFKTVDLSAAAGREKST